MKLYLRGVFTSAAALIALLYGAPAQAAAAGSVRGGVHDETQVHEFTIEAASAMDQEDVGRRLSSLSSLSLAGCDCATIAMMSIIEEQRKALKSIPLSMMGVLDDNKETLWDVKGSKWYPLQEYQRAAEAIGELVKHATDILRCINCGHCDVHETAYPYEGISHQECCCDVRYIQSIVVERMYDIARIALLNPGASEFTCPALDALLNAAKCTVNDLVRPYDCESMTTTTESSTTTITRSTASTNSATIEANTTSTEPTASTSTSTATTSTEPTTSTSTSTATTSTEPKTSTSTSTEPIVVTPTAPLECPSIEINCTPDVSSVKVCSTKDDDERKNLGKPSEITFKYVADDCDQSDNTQNEDSGDDKFNCEDFGGGPTDDALIVVYYEEKGDEDQRDLIEFARFVTSVEGTFTVSHLLYDGVDSAEEESLGDITAAAPGGSGGSEGGGSDKIQCSKNLKSRTFLRVYERDETDLSNILQEVEVHTSCSAPLVVGEQYGAFVNAGMVSCADAGQPTDCESIPRRREEEEERIGFDKTYCQQFKPFKAMMFSYAYQDCSGFAQSEDGKGFCESANPLPADTTIVPENTGLWNGKTNKENRAKEGDGARLTVESSNSTHFTIAFNPEDYDDIEHQIIFDLKNKDNVLIQTVEIHISCSSEVFNVNLASLLLEEVTGGDDPVKKTTTWSSKGGTRAGTELLYKYTITNPNDYAIDVTAIVHEWEQPCADKSGEIFVDGGFAMAANEVRTLGHKMMIDVTVAGPIDSTVHVEDLASQEGHENVSVDTHRARVLAGCDNEDGDGLKPSSMKLKYVGGGCDDTTNNKQSSYECIEKDGPANVPASFIIVAVGEDGDKNAVFSDVDIDVIFDVEPVSSNTKVTLVFSNDGPHFEIVFDTSCSQPLHAGDRFGPIEVVEWTTNDGTVISEECEAP